ncbi:putative methyltransferase domain containing protein [Amanita muscaria]
MFYYLSFLRPPPSQAQPFQPIPITPQIANDLRTEHYGGEQDIFYSWRQVPTSRNETPTATKLTRWRQSTAYKEILVPAPPGVKDGQTWRLVLSCRGPGLNSATGAGSEEYGVIPLGDSHMGALPFPVLSMPIVFSSPIQKRVVAQKQEKIERVYRILLPQRRDSDPSSPARVAIQLTEQTSFDLDKKIWDSGIGLSSWLVNLAHAAHDDGPPTDLDESLKLKSRLVRESRDALFADQPRNIVELVKLLAGVSCVGAGTGIVALTIGALRAALGPADANPESHIITTDLESAMPMLEHNINSNVKLFRENAGARPLAMVLDWDDEEIPEYIQNVSGQTGIDAIVMADVTYNTSAFPALMRTLRKLVKLGQKPPLILLGYKERDIAERSLWDLAKEENIHFTLIEKIQGAGDAPIEIWIGRVIDS